MPHSSDDPPTMPPSETSASEAPSASGPDSPADAHGARESAGEVSDAPGAPQNGEARRPRHRRRRRRRPQPIAAPGQESGEAQPGAAESTASYDRPLDEGGGGGEAQAGVTSPAADPIAVESAQAAPLGESRQPRPPRRRRRRRGPLRDAGSQPPVMSEDAGSGEGPVAGDQDSSAAGGEESQTLRSHAPDTAAPERPRTRTRRRRPPRAGLVPGGEIREGSDAATSAAPGPSAPQARRRRTGEWQNRPQNDAGPRESAARDGGLQERRGPGSGRANEDRGRGPRGRAGGDRGSRDRRQGRGRDAPQKRIEQKLYALESVVDRGFEDVTDESDENTSRRIHWTIIKRTVADQKSGKPMSAVYVLQREGVESEFPNLGAARLAVNKTIVHPEKLTLSKAEHVAAKK
jgi:hypothetical protein